MGKRYYCDYCDRHFVDDLEARKKHLAGVIHMRVRKEYYDQFKDAETRYKEEIAKVVCKRFQRFGECAFGLNCRYSHYSHEELEILRQQVEEQKLQARFGNSLQNGIPTLTSWLEKRNQTKLLSNTSSSINNTSTIWGLPSSLNDRPDLPPSLQPIKLEDFTHSEFDAWG